MLIFYMRKRRKALVWSVIGLSIVIAVVLVSMPPPPSRDNQPAYKGRTLAQWLDVGAHSPNHWVWGPRNDGKGPTPQQLREAEDSVRAIGTNAIPTLLEWISYKHSPIKQCYKNALEVLPMPQQARILLFMSGYKHEARSDLAVLGFALLNTNALPAREELSKLVRDANDAGEPWRQRTFEKILFTVTNTPGQ